MTVPPPSSNQQTRSGRHRSDLGPVFLDDSVCSIPQYTVTYCSNSYRLPVEGQPHDRKQHLGRILGLLPRSLDYPQETPECPLQSDPKAWGPPSKDKVCQLSRLQGPAFQIFSQSPGGSSTPACCLSTPPSLRLPAASCVSMLQLLRGVSIEAEGDAGVLVVLIQTHAVHFLGLPC